MKRFALLLLLLCNVPLQSASPTQTASSLLQKILQNPAYQKAATLLKKTGEVITNHFPWKTVGIVVVGLLLTKIVHDTLQRRQMTPSPLYPERKRQERETIKQTLIEQGNFPAVIADMVVQYTKTEPKPYELHKTMSPPLAFAGPFTLNADGTKGLTIQNGRDASSLRIWDTKQGTIIKELNAYKSARKQFLTAYFANNETARVISTQTQDNSVTIHDIGLDQKNLEQSGYDFNRASEPVVTFVGKEPTETNQVLSAHISGNSQIIAVERNNGTIDIGQIPLRSVKARIPYTQTINFDRYYQGIYGTATIAFNYSGTQAIVDNHKVASLWDIHTATKTRDFVLPIPIPSFDQTISFSPDETQVAIAGFENKAARRINNMAVYVIDVKTHVTNIKLSPLGPHSCFIVYDHNGSLIAIPNDNNVDLWNTENGKFFQTLPHGAAPVIYAKFSDDDSTLATTDRNGVVRIWRIEDKKRIQAGE